MLVWATVTTPSVLTVSLQGREGFPFACCGEMLVTDVGIMVGRGTLVRADSSVVARTTGGGRVTTGIIVDETLVWV